MCPDVSTQPSLFTDDERSHRREHLAARPPAQAHEGFVNLVATSIAWVNMRAPQPQNGLRPIIASL